MDFFRGLPAGIVLGDPQANSECILMVVALDDIRKRQGPRRIQRHGGFADAITARWRLVEDECKWLAKFASGAQRRQRRLDVSRTGPCRDQTYVGGADCACAQVVGRCGRVDDGQRFWLYRDGLYQQNGLAPRWYLQGLFA